MSKASLKKEDRILANAAKTGLSTSVIRQVLNSDDEVIAEGLRAGKRVYMDNVGTLHVAVVKATRRYIPSKKALMDIAEHTKIKFVASKTLVERV